MKLARKTENGTSVWNENKQERWHNLVEEGSACMPFFRTQGEFEWREI